MPDLQRSFLRLHQSIYERSGGLVGHRMTGTRSLLLTTTGRRSGEARRAALIYARDGADWVLVASNHGLGTPPAWLLNIRSNPSVTVQVARRVTRATARVVERGEPGYDRLWGLANASNRNRYDGYQARTERPIPLVVITPATAAG